MNFESLEWMLEYWLKVEKSTLEHFAEFEASQLQRLVDDLTVEEILWHVMQHEVRHSAQIAILARQLGFAPPHLDLLAYAGKRKS